MKLPLNKDTQDAMIKEAIGSTFLGIPINELGCDELLVAIGYQIHESAQEKRLHQKTIDLFTLKPRVKL
jgi:hypothetical protein